MDKIFEEYSMTVYKYLLSLVRDEQVAEELTQETFYRATKNIDKFNEKSKISTWLIGISKNVYYEYLRKNKIEYDISEVIDKNLETKSSEDIAIENYSRVEIFKTLHKCPYPKKEVVYLRVFGNLSFKEIGEVMDKSENWARVTYHRAKALLKEELERYEK